MELICAAYLLPIDAEPIHDGAVAVELGRIAAVGPKKELAAQYPNATVRDFPHHVVMPGLVNAHCHIDLTNFIYDESLSSPATSDSAPPEPVEGRPATESLHLHWLIQSIQYRQHVPLDQLVAGIRRGLQQLIHSGTTCAGIVSGYDGIIELLEDSGLRINLYPEIFAQGSADRAQDRFESALALLEEHADANPSHLRIGLGPVTPYVLSRHLLRVISQHAKQAAIPLQIHAAESFAEMEFFFDSTGPIGTQLFPAIGWGSASGSELPPPFHKTPIQYLSEIGFLDAAPSIVGGIHLGERDFTLLARHMCRTVFAPRANTTFGHGQCPVTKLEEHGVAVGLGTEATTQSADGNLWEEMRAALESPGITPKGLLHMATLGGARVLGWEHRIGSLTPGKVADFLVCDLPPNAPSPPLLYDTLIRHTTPTRVRHTVIGGQWIKTC